MSFYYIFTCLLLFIIFLYMVIKLISLKTYFKSFKIKMSPFECGFDVNKKSRMPFSSRFFLLAILFLIFDIEIVLLIPMIMMNNLTLNSFMSIIIFFVILNLGLFHEWREGSLDWAI